MLPINDIFCEVINKPKLILHTRLPPMEGQQNKHNIQGDIRILLGKDCEVEKIMRFLREMGMFEEI